MEKERSAEFNILNAIGPVRPEFIEAVAMALSERFSAWEEEIVTKIETRRRQLAKSGDIVEMTDYGAGAPGLSLTRDQMDQGRSVSRSLVELVQSASKSPAYCAFLFQVIRRLKPLQCLELGTCLGITCAYQAAALTVNGRGKIATIEGCPTIAAIAQKTLSDAGLLNARIIVGRFKDKVLPVLEELVTVDYVFLDGHHNGDATMEYFEQMRPFLARGTVTVIMDDIAWDAGMREAWLRIRTDPLFQFSFEFGPLGICHRNAVDC